MKPCASALNLADALASKARGAQGRRCVGRRKSPRQL